MSDLFPSPPRHSPACQLDDDGEDPEDPFSNLVPMNYQHNDQQHQQFAENDVPEQRNGDVHVEEDDLIKKVIAENDFLKPSEVKKNEQRPVLPGESGEGLPYAPVDWPSPGDNWVWRVGRRHNSTGFYQDRFLYLPKRLQRTGRHMFASKKAVENFIRAVFPDASVDAFFASFSWNIPVKIPSPTKEVALFNLEAPPPEETKEVQQEEVHKSGRSKRRQSVTPPPPPLSSTEEVQENKEEFHPSGRKKRKSVVRSPSSAPTVEKPVRPQRRAKMPKENGVVSSLSTKSPSTSGRKSRKRGATSAGGGEVNPLEETALVIPEDFDNYLNSLDAIICQPIATAPPESAVTETFTAEDELAEARNKLSSLLAMDFSSLVMSKSTTELVALATKLRKDPRLSADQLVKLKLIEEIPSFSEVFLESRQIIDQVTNFFFVLEKNKNKVNSLKSEYNELKDKSDQLQSQVDSNVLAVQEIDKQIAQLQSWRAELMGTIDSNKSAKLEVNKAQKIVANEIPVVVHEIQVSNTKMPEWELKKSNAEKREAEILAKFAPLKGFYL